MVLWRQHPAAARACACLLQRRLPALGSRPALPAPPSPPAGLQQDPPEGVNASPQAENIMRCVGRGGVVAQHGGREECRRCGCRRSHLPAVPPPLSPMHAPSCSPLANTNAGGARLSLDLHHLPLAILPLSTPWPPLTRPHRWNAVIFGPDGTVWDGGVFKLSLEFSEDYPNKVCVGGARWAGLRRAVGGAGGEGWRGGLERRGAHSTARGVEVEAWGWGAATLREAGRRSATHDCLASPTHPPSLPACRRRWSSSAPRSSTPTVGAAAGRAV
jgi:hypothetical protein